MKQYGDITKLNGYDLDPVDLIVGGSPCQDLSVAGTRKGLDGERSGLFLEMIRIIKEMRKETNGVYPRFALWENVPGAFSSNDGKDFGAVLGEFARIIEPNAPNVPVPKDGWANSGVLLVGGGGSVAYRTHDAQFWGKTIRDSRTGDVLQMGTPQRRRRIALVADFRGQSASEILFERKSLSGNLEPGETQREDPTGTAENSIRSASEEILMVEMTSTKNTVIENGISPTITSRMGTGGNQVNAVMTMQGFGDYIESDTASACKQRDWKDATDLVCRIDNLNSNNVCRQGNYVRRLTPLECERLQGYPDGWTNIPRASDAKRYKALGNSICLPAWEFWARRFAEIGNVKTIGSLFDGIGGFPLVFKRAGAKTLWTSEIEPFCEKVVKYHFGNEETGEDGDIWKYVK
jgi:DNA (cytosine-5)-methyltransferase 1